MTEIRTFWSKFKGFFKKSLFFLMAGQALAQVINFAAMPFISRSFSENSIGQLSVLLSMGMVFQAVATFKSDLAIVQSADMQERRSLFSFGVCAFTVLVCLSALFTFGQFFGKHGQNPLWVIGLYIGLGLTFMLQALDVSLKNFNQLTLFRLALAVLFYPFSLVMEPYFGEKALFYALMTTYWLPALCYLVFRKDFRLGFSISKNDIFAVLTKHKKTMSYLTASSLVSSVNSHFFIFVISFYFPLEYVAAYFFALKVSNAPISLINSSLSQYNYARFEALFSKNAFTRQVVLDEWKKWICLALPFYLALFFFGNKIMPFVFGEKWLLSGTIVQVLALSGLFVFLSSITGFAFLTIQKQEVDFRLTTVFLLRPIILFGMVLGGLPFMTVLWAAVSMEVVYLFIRNGLLLHLLGKVKKG